MKIVFMVLGVVFTIATIFIQADTQRIMLLILGCFNLIMARLEE
jgi:hypothetical protein